MPFVSAGALMLSIGSAEVSNPLVNVIYGLYYFGFPAGFVCLLFVSAWLAMLKAGTALSTNIFKMGTGCLPTTSNTSIGAYERIGR